MGQKNNVAGRVTNMRLQSKIQGLSNGRLPASQALAKVSFVLRSDNRVQNILMSEIRAPKMAVINRAGR